MHTHFFLKSLFVIVTLVVGILCVSSLRSSGGLVSAQTGITQGALQVIDPNGKPKALCPLKHTDVKAEISGFLSRVVVTQEFENPFKEKIEAVYTFPLPQNAGRRRLGRCLPLRRWSDRCAQYEKARRQRRTSR